MIRGRMDAHAARPPSRAMPGAALVVGVAAVSSAAILVSLARAHGIPALWIAGLRVSVAALVVVPVAVARCRGEIRSLSGKDVGLGAASGAFLALHFGLWTTSLDSTSVMSSVVFVSTNPLFVAIASAVLFRETLRGATVAGIAAAMAGGVIVGLADVAQAGSASTRGDVLALLAAASGSAYLLVGRRLRPRMSLPLYVGIVYPVAAGALVATALIAGAPLQHASLAGLTWVAFLAIGPQLLGHTSYNYALKYVSATFVTITLLAEPIGATLLAIPALGQVPTLPRVVGGVLILCGILIAARAEKPPRNGAPSV